MATKIRYPKCPYCQKQFQDSLGNYDGMKLTNLAINGDKKDTIITCTNCNEKYKVTVKIMFYSSKLKGE